MGRFKGVVIQGFLDQLEKNCSGTLSYQYSNTAFSGSCHFSFGREKSLKFAAKYLKKDDAHISSKHKNACQWVSQ